MLVVSLSSISVTVSCDSDSAEEGCQDPLRIGDSVDAEPYRGVTLLGSLATTARSDVPLASLRVSSSKVLQYGVFLSRHGNNYTCSEI
jgi:hypothetical protein